MRTRAELRFHVALKRWAFDYQRRCHHDYVTASAEDALFDAYAEWPLPLELIAALNVLEESGVYS